MCTAARREREPWGEVVSPHASRVDDRACPHAQLLAGAVVDPRLAVGGPEHPRARHNVGAVAGSRASERDDRSRVVLDRAVPVHEPAAQPALAQTGRQQPCGPGIDAARAGEHARGEPAQGAQHVGEADPDLRERVLDPAADAAVAELWDEERARLHEVRRDPAQQRFAFDRGLPREGDVALREVAQPAVDELRAVAARAAREIARLDECDRQAAGNGVERDAGAGDAAADDEHVDLVFGDVGERTGAARSVQVSWSCVEHAAPVLGWRGASPVI